MGAGPLLVVLTGPSGAGKDTLLAELNSHSGRYHIAVNATTRPPRAGERNGVDYHFVSRDEFQRMLRDSDLLEHALVYGQDKGVPKRPIREALAAGKDVLLRTDIQGARTIKSLVPGAVTIFVAPPSVEELKRRVRSRGADTPEQIELRERIATEEMAAAGEFDHTVVNDDLTRCAEEIEAIMSRERLRRDRMPVVI